MKRPEEELRVVWNAGEVKRAAERERNVWRAVCVLLALVIAAFLVWRLR